MAASWNEPHTTHPEWLVGPAATTLSFLLLGYIVASLMMLVVGVDKVGACVERVQRRLETLERWRRECPTTVNLSADTKKRKKRPGRRPKSRQTWSQFFMGGGDSDNEDIDEGPFNLDDSAWTLPCAVGPAARKPSQHFIGESEKVPSEQDEDVFELPDDIWYVPTSSAGEA